MGKKCKLLFLWRLVSIIMFLFFNVSLILAQGFKNPPEGISALSQAGAFIAQCDDASAVSHNPAGLAQIEGEQIMFGSVFLYPTTSYKNGGSEDAVSNMAYLPFIYYATNMGRENLRFGIGLSSPYGQATEWSDDVIKNWGVNLITGTYTIPYYSSMQTINASPVLAYKFTPQFSAGLGLNLYYSKLGVNYLTLADMPAKIETAGTGLGGILGLLYKEKNYSIGFNYKSGFDIDYDGNFKVPGVLKTDASLEMKYPQIAGIGLAVYPNQKMKIEFDAEWTDYSCLEKIPVDITGVTSYDVPKKWKDCYMFSLGTEYKKSESIKLRGGIAYLTNPVPDSTWDPSLPASDSIVVVVGGESLSRFGSFSLSLGANIYRERKLEKGELYDGKYRSTGYFCTLGYKKSF
jgi:long-chain fatty acid transport protein